MALVGRWKLDRSDLMTTEPLSLVLTRLMAERDVSGAGVAKKLREKYDWGSAVAVSKMRQGELVPSIEGMRRLADVLEVEPEVFAEYRLAVVRESLDWREVGLDRAVKNLEALGG